MKKLINTNQLSRILFISMISIKLIAFPAISYKIAGNSSYIALIFSFTLDLLALIMFLSIMKKEPDITFDRLLQETFGKVITKIIYVLLFVYFFWKSVVILKQAHNYFLEVLFDDINWVYFIAPLLTLLGYIAYKNVRTIARTVEMFFLLILIGISLSMLLSLDRIDIANLFPIMPNNSIEVLHSIARCSFSFGDFLLLTIFMGKIDFGKKSMKKIYIYIIGAIFFVVQFYLLFVAIFGDTAISQNLALSELSLSSTRPATIGRLDWMTIIIWTITLILQAGILLYCGKICLEIVFHFKNSYTAITVIEILLLLVIVILYLSLEQTLRVVTSIPFIVFVIMMQVIIPGVILPLAYYLAKKKNKLDEIKRKSKLDMMMEMQVDDEIIKEVEEIL